MPGSDADFVIVRYKFRYTNRCSMMKLTCCNSSGTQRRRSPRSISLIRCYTTTSTVSATHDQGYTLQARKADIVTLKTPRTKG